MTYRDIPDAEVEVGAPTKSDTAKALRDNPKAMASREVGAPQIVPLKRQVFTSSGTFTPPSNVKYVNVICTGAGATGGAGNDSSDSGYGGSAGATAIGQFDVSSLSSIPVTVGTNGGNSSFGALCSANGSGGTASGGDINITGGGGGPGSNFQNDFPGGGVGGASYWGGPGAYGAGGNGGNGRTEGQGSSPGSAGTQGIVVVEY